jgi:hypothetical protein
MGQHWHDGYSATVDAYLVVGELRIAVAQVAGSSLILRTPQAIPAGTKAQLVISIDGEAKIQDIRLGDGASVPQQLIPYNELSKT